MGLFSLFKKKEAPPEPEPQEEAISVDGLQPWFSEAFGDQVEDMTAKARKMSRKVSESMRSMEGVADALDKAKFESDDRIHTAANSIKRDYAKKLKGVIRCGLDEPRGNYESLKSFHMSTNQAIGELLSMGPKQAILLSKFFSSEMKTVMAEIRKTKELLDGMGSFLKEDGRVIFLSDRLSEMMKSREAVLGRLEEARRHLKENESEGASERVAEAGKALDGFESGAEWKSYLSSRRALESAKKEASSARESISLALSVSKRPLKKFKHKSDKNVDGLISDAFSEFISNPGFFRNAVSDMLEAKLELKQKEKEKLQDLLEQLPSLEDSSARYKELSARASEMEKELENHLAAKEKERLEEAIREAKTRKERLDSESKKTEERISQLSGEAAGFIKKLETLVNSNSKRRIRLN